MLLNQFGLDTSYLEANSKRKAVFEASVGRKSLR